MHGQDRASLLFRPSVYNENERGAFFIPFADNQQPLHQENRKVEYLIGAIAGLIYGGIVAFLKSRFLWKRSLQSDTPEHIGGVLGASALSFFINVLALALVFFLRNRLPFHWAACLIATAVGVSVLQPYLISRYKPNAAAAEEDNNVTDDTTL